MSRPGKPRAWSCHKWFLSRLSRRNPYVNRKMACCSSARYRKTHFVNQDYHQAVGAVSNGPPHWAQAQAVLSPGERKRGRRLRDEHRSTKIEFTGICLSPKTTVECSQRDALATLASAQRRA
jgi:hypothetical protein